MAYSLLRQCTVVWGWGGGGGGGTGQTEGWAQSCWGRVLQASAGGWEPAPPHPAPLPQGGEPGQGHPGSVVLGDGRARTKAACLRPSPLPSQLPRPARR